MIKVFEKFIVDESGATAIEYGLIASLVCMAIIGGIRAVGIETEDMYTTITNAVLGTP
jgi:pilus assembly protein Flp/PilA